MSSLPPSQVQGETRGGMASLRKDKSCSKNEVVAAPSSRKATTRSNDVPEGESGTSSEDWNSAETKDREQEKDAETRRRLSKWSYTTVVLYLYFIHVTTMDWRFIFYVNERDVSTVSTRQTFRTNESALKESTGSILNSTGKFGAIYRAHVWIV